MAGYRLFIKPSAVRELEDIPTKKDRQRIVTRIRRLVDDPRPHQSEKLAGREDAWRVRQGRYRVIYRIDEETHAIEVVKVGHRKDVYR